MTRDVDSEFTTAGPTPSSILDLLCDLEHFIKALWHRAASVKLGQQHGNTASTLSSLARHFYHNLASTNNGMSCTEYKINLGQHTEMGRQDINPQEGWGNKLSGITMDYKAFQQYGFRQTSITIIIKRQEHAVPMLEWKTGSQVLYLSSMSTLRDAITVSVLGIMAAHLYFPG